MGAGARGLAVAAGVVGLGLFFLLGARGIAGEAQYAGVGPRAFPTLVGAGLVIVGGALGVAVLRGRAFPSLPPPVERGALPWILSGLALAVPLLQPLGFALTAALVFVLTARGFGSRGWGRDALVGLLLGVAVYLVFSLGLGVSLPGGPFDWR